MGPTPLVYWGFGNIPKLPPTGHQKHTVSCKTWYINLLHWWEPMISNIRSPSGEVIRQQIWRRKRATRQDWWFRKRFRVSLALFCSWNAMKSSLGIFVLGFVLSEIVLSFCFLSCRISKFKRGIIAFNLPNNILIIINSLYLIYWMVSEQYYSFT